MEDTQKAGKAFTIGNSPFTIYHFLQDFLVQQVCLGGRNVVEKETPIRVINFDNPADKARHERMVSLVERMLELQKQLSAAQVPQAKTLLKRQIALTDRQIDELVYALYNLSEEDEIKIVEGAQ